MNEKPETAFENLKSLNLSSIDGTGYMSISVKNGYPRFTFFNKEEKGRFITAPVDPLSMYTIIRSMRAVILMDEDKKFAYVCKNRDYNTREVILQSILVIARRGDDILIGIKPTRDAKASVCRISLPIYVETEEDDKPKSLREALRERALSFVALLEKFMDLHCTKDIDRIPNSERANPSHAPVAAPVSKVDAIEEYVPKPPETGNSTIDNVPSGNADDVDDF